MSVSDEDRHFSIPPTVVLPLQVNVFVLGMVFQQLVKLLNMESNAMLARSGLP